ncbi:Uncharacterized protein TCM_041981 [Theobroma cacao]|uniref:Uncharacterized protein n=1 Tax=Theobroma cacao TaxID=3641 RepID=A0A061GYF3_THECC|nr:Uncharacterized protein TCM_041981 [Theobroma cacao]
MYNCIYEIYRIVAPHAVGPKRHVKKTFGITLPYLLTAEMLIVGVGGHSHTLPVAQSCALFLVRPIISVKIQDGSDFCCSWSYFPCLSSWEK